MTKTYAQVQEQIEALQREAEKLKRKEVEGVIARIQEAIRAYGLTAGDLGLNGSRGGARGTLAKSGKKAKPAASAKYRDEAGNVWGGRGPRPQWLRDALSAGKTLEDFAVGGARAKPPITSIGAAPRKPAAKKASSKKTSGKAKYRDDAGNSWTGMGPQPRWLKEAVAGGKKLEEFRV